VVSSLWSVVNEAGSWEAKKALKLGQF